MTLLSLAEWVAAVVVLAMALRNVNAMTRSTCHWVRLANVILAISAFAIFAAPAYDGRGAELARAVAHVGVLLALALLFLRGRRTTDRAPA